MGFTTISAVDVAMTRQRSSWKKKIKKPVTTVVPGISFVSRASAAKTPAGLAEVAYLTRALKAPTGASPFPAAIPGRGAGNGPARGRGARGRAD